MTEPRMDEFSWVTWAARVGGSVVVAIGLGWLGRWLGKVDDNLADL